MSDRSYKIGEWDVFACAEEGHPLNNDQAAVDIIGQSYMLRPHWIVIPISRFDATFFQLKTRVAGEFLQKFMNYGLRVAIIGDIDGHVEKSTALRDFVRESNRGEQIWFVKTEDEFCGRLQAN